MPFTLKTTQAARTQHIWGLDFGVYIPQQFQSTTGTNHGIRQAIRFRITTAAQADDTIIITDGTTTETYIFKASPGAAFEVSTAGGSAGAQMGQLAQVMANDSAIVNAVPIAFDGSNNDLIIYAITDNTNLRMHTGVAVTLVCTERRLNGGRYDQRISATTLATSDPGYTTYGLYAEAEDLYGSEVYIQALGVSYTMSEDGNWDVSTYAQDDANLDLTTSGTISGVDQDTGIDVGGSKGLLGAVHVYVNGIQETVGNGTKTGVAFFFTTDSGTSALSFNSINPGAELYVNTTNLGYDLDTSDRIDIKSVVLNQFVAV